MKKISLLSTLLLLLAQAMYAQQEGLNFQGVARDASGAVMANKNINLQLTIIGTVENGEVGFVEYTEIIQATTNAQGIFAVVIGALGSVEFEAIDWTLVPKYLKVGMDQNGGTQFITMGITQLQTVPFAHFANGVKAEDIDGIVPIEQGGTGVTSIESLKTSLSLETKEDVSNKSTDTSLGTSEELYPTQNAVKSYVDLATNQATTDARYLTLSGGSMSGDIAMGANDISGAGTVSATTFSGDLSGTINTATTATTQSAGDNSTKVATTAYVDASPSGSALVADAINDGTTTIAPSQNVVFDALALKLDLAGGSMGGDIAMGANDISGAGTVSATTFSGDLNGTINTATTATTQTVGTSTTQLATTEFVNTASSAKVADAITNGTTTIAPSQNAVFDALALKLDLVGGSMSGDIAMGANDISGAGTVSATTFAGDLSGTINTATTATTQSAVDNSTKVATTAYADAAAKNIVSDFIVAGIADIAPSQNAVSLALGTVYDELSSKLDLAGGTMSGDIAMGANDISGAGTVSATTFAGDLNGTINTATTATTQSVGDNSTKVATTAYADAALTLKLDLAGGSMSGDIAMGANDISGAGTVSATTFGGDLSGTINTATIATTQSAGDNSTKVATTAYADAALALKVPYTGATGEVDFGAYDLTVNGVMIGKGGVTGNTRIGASALNRNSIGDGVHNTAVGFAAITTAATADNNTGVGYLALFLTTGGDNTAIGNEAGFLNVTGSQNTYIGSKTGSSPNNLTNTTAIGYNAAATTSNSIILGNSSIATLRCQVNSISSLSDGRDKTDILTLSEGLDFIKQLKPVTFTWNTRDKAKVGIKSAGFIAQDLLALQQNSTIGANLDLVSFENPDKLEARYANLLPIMVKAIQEETDLRVKEMEVKDQEITDLKERLSSLEDLVNQLLAEQQK